MRQTDKRPGRQTEDRQTDKQTDKQIDKTEDRDKAKNCMGLQGTYS